MPVPADLAAERPVFDHALGSGTSVTLTRAAISLALPSRSALYLH